MAEPRRPDIAVAPLARALLEGVDDGSGGPRRRVDLGVLPIFEDERPLQGLAGLVDWRMGGSLSALLRAGFCTGAACLTAPRKARTRMHIKESVMLGDKELSIETGKLADAVVVHGDPLSDIDGLGTPENILLVVKDGVAVGNRGGFAV